MLHTIAILYYMICYFLQKGCTPIHLASRDGHVQAVEKLISSRADVNAVDKVSVNRHYSYTVLHDILLLTGWIHTHPFGFNILSCSSG